MIFEENGHEQSVLIEDEIPANIFVSDILVACAAEANRQARAAEELDNIVGSILLRDAMEVDPSSLQKLDLLRQEIEGLARILQVVARRDEQGATIEGAVVAGCFALEAQRARIVRSRDRN